MSDFLLQKSCRVLLDSKHIKKTKKSEKLRLRKKKYLFNSKEIKEKELEDNILRNLQKLEEFSKKSAVDVCDKVFSKCDRKAELETDKEQEEESTVFTDKDFEDFEKEYFDS